MAHTWLFRPGIMLLHFAIGHTIYRVKLCLFAKRLSLPNNHAADANRAVVSFVRPREGNSMTTRNTLTTPRRVLWSIAGLNLAMLLAGLIQIIFFPQYQDFSSDSILNLVARILNIPIYTLLALLIVSRQPWHTIGWLFLAVGFFQAVPSMIGPQTKEVYLSSRLVISL